MQYARAKYQGNSRQKKFLFCSKILRVIVSLFLFSPFDTPEGAYLVNIDSYRLPLGVDNFSEAQVVKTNSGFIANAHFKEFQPHNSKSGLTKDSLGLSPDLKVAVSDRYNLYLESVLMLFDKTKSRFESEVELGKSYFIFASYVPTRIEIDNDVRGY